MSLVCSLERPAVWDAGKARILGRAASCELGFGTRRFGDLLRNEWWRVDDDGQPVAYAWIETVWGDAELFLVVDPEHRGRGVGRFLLGEVRRQAADRGLRFLYHTINESDPDRSWLTTWLTSQGFNAVLGGVLRLDLNSAAVRSLCSVSPASFPLHNNHQR